MNVLGIGGSPRKKGNSDTLLDAALRGAESRGAKVDKVVLNDLTIAPCRECCHCDETARCVIRDDMRIIYRKFEDADRIVIASPIFFGSLSAQTKMMIDRFQPIWIRKYILKKRPLFGKNRKGAFICVGGSKGKKFFDNASSIVKILFKTIDVDYACGLFCGGVDRKSDIFRDKKALKKAFDIGKSLVK